MPVLSHRCNDCYKTLLFDVILAQIEFLQASVSLEYLGDLSAATIFQRVLRYVKLADILADFDRTCNQLEQIIAHLDSDELERPQSWILNQVVVNCHDVQLV